MDNLATLPIVTNNIKLFIVTVDDLLKYLLVICTLFYYEQKYENIHFIYDLSRLFFASLFLLFVILAFCTSGIFLLVMLRLGTHLFLESFSKSFLVSLNSLEYCFQTEATGIL